MAFRNPLRIMNDNPEFLIVIVEPWASTYRLSIGEDCEVVAVHPELMPTWCISPDPDGDLMVCIHESGSTYEFWRAGVLEDSMPIPIP